MESNSVRNHTSDNKIGRPRSGSPICLSRVGWHEVLLQLNNKKLQFPRKENNLHKKTDKGGVNCLIVWLVDLNYNFECDWLILTIALNVIGLLKCPITNCPTTNCPITNELVENRIFFKPITSEEILILWWIWLIYLNSVTAEKSWKKKFQINSEICYNSSPMLGNIYRNIRLKERPKKGSFRRQAKRRKEEGDRAAVWWKNVTNDEVRSEQTRKWLTLGHYLLASLRSLKFLTSSLIFSSAVLILSQWVHSMLLYKYFINKSLQTTIGNNNISLVINTNSNLKKTQKLKLLDYFPFPPKIQSS